MSPNGRNDKARFWTPRGIPYMPVLTTVLLSSMAAMSNAATIRVNTMVDNTVAGDGSCTLREAVENANNNSDTTLGDCRGGSGADRIRLLNRPPNYVLSLGQLSITDDLTVFGSNAKRVAIDGAGLSRIFRIQGAISVKFIKLSMEGGRSNDGGALSVPVGAEATVQNCVLAGNIAGNLGGGAILNRGGVTVKNSQFIDNATSAGAGAAIRNEGGVVYVSGSKFTDNHASPSYAGGAILNVGFVGVGHMVIHASSFTGNSSSRAHGGAIENNGFLVVSNSVFDSNRAGQTGGAIRNATVEALYISKSTFLGNVAGRNGGAIYNSSIPANPPNLVIDQSKFKDNTTNGNGGAIWNGAELSILNKSKLTMNDAAGNGGGVFNTSDYTLVDSTNKRNAPNNCAGPGGCP